MESDSDFIDGGEETKNSNAYHVKLALLILATFVLVSSNVFVQRVLGRFNGAVEGNRPTGYGTFIQAGADVVAVMAFIILLDRGYL